MGTRNTRFIADGRGVSNGALRRMQRLVRIFPIPMIKGPLLIIAGSSTIINTKTSRNRT
ncbi:hypothetical protein D3C80_615570 [compost metagenome]